MAEPEEALASAAVDDRLREVGVPLPIDDLARDIPGHDLRDYRSAVLAAWIDWDDCLTANQGQLTPCGDFQTAYEQAFVDFYDAMR